MTPSDTSNVLPETAAAERLRQHLRGNRARTRPGASRAAGARGGAGADPAHRPASAASKSISATASRTAARPNISSSTACRRRRPTRPTRIGSTGSIPRIASGRSSISSTRCRARARTIPPNTASSGRTTAQTRWIRVVAKIERDSDGRALRLVGAHIDVTDQMLAQETLRESEERFRLIADSAPVPIWVTKLDRTRSFANQAYVDFLGLPFEEAIVFDWRKVLHPDDLPRILQESDRRRSLAQAVRAGGALQATPTANGAGCARNRSRAGTRPASISASSASPTTSPPPSRPRSSCAG